MSIADVQSAGERFEAERPHYEELAVAMSERIRVALSDHRIRATVTPRAKEIHSLVKKLLSKPQPYDEVWDKAGLRIVPKYPDDREKVADLVRATFEISWERDYGAPVNAEVFGYRGHHFTARLRDADKAHVGEIAAKLAAEVQVQSPGESVWASICHDIAYKAAQEIPPEVRRSFARVSAFLEAVDLDLSRARKIVLEQDGASEAAVLAVLEEHFLRFTAQHSDANLSRIVVAPLMALLPSNLDHELATFVVEQHEKLKHIYKVYQSNYRHPLLSQPESVLLFYLIENSQQELENEWNQLPMSMLENLVAIWAPS